MPKGKKLCPACGKEHGARKRECECGHKFGQRAKQEGQKVKQSTHPLGQKYIPDPGLWVFDREKGMPPIPLPEPLPTGPLNNQIVYEQCAYNGLGDTLFEFIPSRRIADPKLRKLWKKARDAMHEAWRYLIDDNEGPNAPARGSKKDADNTAAPAPSTEAEA